MKDQILGYKVPYAEDGRNSVVSFRCTKEEKRRFQQAAKLNKQKPTHLLQRIGLFSLEIIEGQNDDAIFTEDLIVQD